MNIPYHPDSENGTSACPLSSKFAPSKKRQGSALVATMITVVVVTALVGVTFVATNAASRMSARAKDYIGVQRAAEAAVEYGYGIWKRRIFVSNGAISSDAANASLTGPTLDGFSYASAADNGPLKISATDEYGAPLADTTKTPTRVAVSLLDYPGWRGFASSYLVSAKVTAPGNLASQEVAGVRRRFQYVEVPLFQMMFFFQDSLEFYKPANMIVGGLIHTNADFYASQQAGLTFTGNVSYVGSYTDNKIPPFASTWAGWSGDQPPTFPNGKANQVTQVAAANPMGVALSETFNTTDANPNNDGYREIIEIPDPAYPDPDEIASRRMYNKAGIVLTIDGTTATATSQNGVFVPPGQLAQIQSAFTGKTVIYDQREGKNVDVANIDVSKLTTVFNTGGLAGFNGVLYIVDKTKVVPATPATKTTPANPGSPNPKTIRLQKGGVLPNDGLTIASQNPVYIQGDYNTGTTTSPTAVPANKTGNPSNTDSPTVPGYTRKPSAVMGDAVMFLSNAWVDSNSDDTLSNRSASNTTYNTAVMGGFTPSGYKPESGSQYGYSGGGINYPRFLETWSGNACTYYGSMVELFPSKTFTGQWDTANIYYPPNRRWNFDSNFSTKAPPGGLNAVVYTRGSWSKF
jgi:hypothetical protein